MIFIIFEALEIISLKWPFETIQKVIKVTSTFPVITAPLFRLLPIIISFTFASL